MRSIEPGHKYLMTVYSPNGEETKSYVYTDFIKKIGDNFPGNSGVSRKGTNCQEHLRVLIDRVRYLDNQKHAPENNQIIFHLQAALGFFEIRAARLKGINFVPNGKLEEIAPCEKCGHIFPHTH